MNNDVVYSVSGTNVDSKCVVSSIILLLALLDLLARLSCRLLPKLLVALPRCCDTIPPLLLMEAFSTFFFSYDTSTMTQYTNDLRAAADNLAQVSEIP